MIIRLLVGERGVVKMLNKLFARGTGRGSGPVDYVISKTDPATGQPRLPPPEVLRGDPEITRALINSLDFKHKYTSGVLSFAPEDLPTHTQQALVMTAFEKSAFAGLEQSRYNILWVRHTHTETGRVELHYVTPRVELTTGKSLNIAPPGRKGSDGKPLPPKLFDDLVDYFNLKYNWARPDDPKRKRIFSPGNNALITKANLRQGVERSTTPKQIISDFLSQQIELSLIEDRNDVVTVLKEAGFSIPRQGKDYITVVDEQTQTRHRLKGGIYEQDFSITATLGSEKSAGSRPTDRDQQSDVGDIFQQLKRAVSKRYQYNRTRYGTEDPADQIAIEQLITSARNDNSKNDRQEVQDLDSDLHHLLLLPWDRISGIGDGNEPVGRQNPTASTAVGSNGDSNHHQATSDSIDGIRTGSAKRRLVYQNTQQSRYPAHSDRQARSTLPQVSVSRKKQQFKGQLIDQRYHSVGLAEQLGIGTIHFVDKLADKVTIRFMTGEVVDTGTKLSATGMNDSIAAKRLIALAKAKGWHGISLSGSDVFKREAMQLALDEGIHITCKTNQERQLLKEVRDDRVREIIERQLQQASTAIRSGYEAAQSAGERLTGASDGIARNIGAIDERQITRLLANKYPANDSGYLHLS